ncbi:MAG: hypothetical protein JXA37_04315 [Chloroflexia bacterium]|nr:hypothetical protein [Chloroflexia bacterium]
MPEHENKPVGARHASPLFTEQNPLHYHSYLLRLWQERPAAAGQPAVWRLSLEDARSGDRKGFGSVEDLEAFLRQCMQRASEDRRRER